MNSAMQELNELLGAQTLTVRFEGKEYSVRSLNSLSPKEFGLVMTHGRKYEMMTEQQMMAQGEEILKSIDEIFLIIAPDLPRYRPTMKERYDAVIKKKYIRKFSPSLVEYIAILQFWIIQSQDKKKVTNPLLMRRMRR